MGLKNSNKQQIQHNKKQLLKALEESMGIVTNACKRVKLDRSTFYRYYNEDEQFASDVDSMQEYVLDFAENKLLQNIQDKKETSIIFYLKTKGKKRGYIEKQEIDHQSNGEKLSIAPIIIQGVETNITTESDTTE